ncbi:MAG: alpha/beta hydrolase [Edaphobacter sp.]|uniref:alpha/beta hydrolase n=1 Tax=Edaphobacter sp. TaxID=1934404 RepID=UPI0023A1C65B|nr:alpha/beta hydrolase [Edaphobacter sp.]MDE1177525.1 alpha/beta hydrolase [Edaphobacter sp.]
MKRFFELVDPELRPAAEAVGNIAEDMPTPTAEMTSSELEIALLKWRSVPAASFPEAPALERKIKVEEIRVPGEPGQPPVRCLLINSSPGGAKPAILHTHGGGFILGKPDDFVPYLRAYADALDCVILSVDYRLAPESTYRESVSDNYSALKWLHAKGDGLGVDVSRIAIMGESAGGGHATLLAEKAARLGEVPVVFLCLTYPMLDDRTGSQPVPSHIGATVWTAANNRLGWRAFLGTEVGQDVPVGAVPFRLPELGLLPPTWIGVGALDLFVEEDIAFAQRLIQVGVPVELLVVPGAFHAFDALALGASVSQSFQLARLNNLAKAFGRPHIAVVPAALLPPK